MVLSRFGILLLVLSIPLTMFSFVLAESSPLYEYDEVMADVDNYAIILNSSRYWFNYRHQANALALYNELKKNGYDDEHIVFMNCLEASEDPRNSFSGEVFSANRSPTSNYRHLTIKNNTMHHSDVHRFGTETGYTPGQIQLDYNGRTCSAENFLNILTGNHPKGFPRNMRLNSNKNSHVLLYMTGHGGDEFFKFHDSQELSSDSFGAAISEMYASNRYREMLLVIDTCQASTMANHITSPGVSVISSSTRGENSYAFDKNNIIGLAVIDRFTYLLVQYLQLIRNRKLSERQQQKEVIKNNNVEGYCNLLEIDEIRMNENHKLKNFKITHKLSEFLKYLRQPSRKAFLHSTPILVQTRENNFSRETKQKKWDVNLNNYMNSNKICAYCTESCRGTLTEVCSILVNENLFVPDASFEFECDLLSDL